ncbi:MAG: DapH/DapD/GlmU-related protein [Aeromicrobium sp.]|uniref:acyltransferase n=1 Tax=Aeromicrobium sp. TaxID=1871063 RepID=UPI002638D959|nr:DapH/DapD/GlmU-related protein [Aeromicrobium sp.]MDF1706237.1 DapH/DapD/GlmU-related protein [Aeromicrobium sp.]
MKIVRRAWPNLFRDIVLNSVMASSLFPRPLRWRLLAALGGQAEACAISPSVWFGSSNISIGGGTFINYGCRFNSHGSIRIGRNCNIAMEVLFVTTTHEIGSQQRRAGEPSSRSIAIGDGVWIGARATILPGVNIGDGAIIAAGAVVTADCEANVLYAGVPARALRELSSGSGSRT